MELIFVAIQAALKAGNIVRKGFGTSYQIFSKEGKQNLVTEYDHASEKAIISLIQTHFPDHGFLAEESGLSSQKPSSVLWVIDPLDGTVNFAHHIPVFCIRIAAVKDNEILCGVIYNPLLDELFIAAKDKGAYLNGTKLQVSQKQDLENAVLATGFPYNVDQDPLQCIETFAEMTRLGVPIRRLGSAALDLAYVAAGRFDAYWEVSLRPWDLAAGKLLVEEAGGCVTHYDGSFHELFCDTTVLATNSYLHTLMKNRLHS